MKLRTQLSLIFGGLIVVVLTLVVVSNYQRSYGSLEKVLKEQFSLEPYQQLAEVERTLLLERANGLVERIPVHNGVRRANNILSTPGKGLNYLKTVRNDPENEYYIELSSTYEQMLQALTRIDSIDGQDLAVLISHDGTVITEAFNQVLGSKIQSLDVSIDSVSKQPFWKVLEQFDFRRGYLVYPNGKLYLYGFASFYKRYEHEGVALVGKEIDRGFLRNITQSDKAADKEKDETLAVVVYGDRVVASSEQAEKIGKELVEKPSESATWRSSGGQTFLLKSAPLWSYYLGDEERKQYEEEGLLDQLPPREQVGRVYLLQNVAGIQEAAFSGARATLSLGGLALLVSLLTIPLVANRFTEPIEELSEAMTQVGEGNLEQQVSLDRHSGIAEIKQASESFNQMMIGLRQKKILEHFVPEGTRKEVEALQGRTTELGGKRWERTIMFSDLRGFTSMSEKMTPDEVMAVLNKYLHVMSRAIRLNGGDINEYIGDAILAVFESPDKAVEASIAMNNELLELRKDKSIEALAGLAQGIGLHTGPLVEGNIGEENRRLKRAVVGDTVNLAARIQDRSRDGSHSCIFLSQDTKDRLTGSYDLVHFGDESFKGKAEPVPVWEVKLD